MSVMTATREELRYFMDCWWCANQSLDAYRSGVASPRVEGGPYTHAQVAESIQFALDAAAALGFIQKGASSLADGDLVDIETFSGRPFAKGAKASVVDGKLRAVVVSTRLAIVPGSEDVPILANTGMEVQSTASSYVQSGHLVGVRIKTGRCVLENGTPVLVRNSAKEAVSQGVMGVVGHRITAATLRPEDAIISDGNTIPVPVTGEYSESITPKITNGVILGIQLS